MTGSSEAAALPARSSWLYRLTFAIAGLVGVVAIWFFLVGLADGSVSSFNIGLWAGLLAVIAAVLIGGHRLQAHGYRKSALLVLGVLALPGLLYGLLILLFVASGTRWN